MTYCKYPTKNELSLVFEIIDEVLIRKSHITSRNVQLPPKIVVNKNNSVGGYCHVRFRRRIIKYHMIIWILTNGNIPNGKIIDHIDGNLINNKISNLRLVSYRENQQNQYKHRAGKLVGCHYSKRDKKWIAKLKISGISKNIGYFDTEREAHEAYCAALNILEVT